VRDLVEVCESMGCRLDPVPVANCAGDPTQPALSVINYRELTECRLLICLLPSGPAKDTVYGWCRYFANKRFEWNAY
jgi:hypothetical protein